MDFPQDQASRHCLNQSGANFENWGLLVLQDAQVIDIQRWGREGRLTTPKQPEGLLLNFLPDGQRLTLFTSKGAFEWNLITGWSGPRKYRKGERKQNLKDVFKVTPGQPQFRCGKDWCCVIIDGSLKLTSPREVFEKKRQEWNALPATQRSLLISEGARKRSAKHAAFTMKAVVGLTVSAGLLYGVAWVLNKMAII